MLLVSHKMTFLENEAALLCVTMRKRSRAMTCTMSDMKCLSRCHSVENKFLWHELQVSLSRKRGPPPPPCFIWKVIYGPWPVTWRQWNALVFCAGKVTIYIYVIICHYDTRLSYKGVYRFHSMETSE